MKGVVTREDTELAIRSGVAGIWVSNHGARQLDTVNIRKLPGVFFLLIIHRFLPVLIVLKKLRLPLRVVELIFMSTEDLDVVLMYSKRLLLVRKLSLLADQFFGACLTK